MAQGQVTKIYELRSLGYDQLNQQLIDISKRFQEVKNAKKAAEKASADAAKTQGTESQAFKDAKKAYDDAKVAEMQLRAEKKNLTNESLAATNAAKIEANQQKQAAAAADVAANSYTNLYKSYRELYNLSKNADKNSNISFQGNTYSYDQAIIKLKQLAAAEQDWRRQFTRDNTLVGEYTSGIVQAFKNMGLDELIGGQITKTKQRITQLDSEFVKLKQELSEVGVNGAGNLENIERQLIENRKEAQQLSAQVTTLESEFRGVGNIGNQITESIAGGFKKMRGQLAQFVIGYVGFQAVMRGTSEVIHLNEDLSDSLAQLQIYLHGNKEDADDLFDSLRKLDTRTSIPVLVDIATLVAKKGVAKDEITGITDALNKFFVVAGKDAGDVDETTSSIVKLISIFNDDKHITKERVEEITSALFGLQSTGVATSSKMIDVAERIGAVRGMTGVTLPSVLGFAAAIEQLGQRSEVAGTAGMQILTKMLANVQKYADAAGIPVEKLRKMIKENPFDAVIAVADKLKNGGKDFEAIAQDFEEVGISGARVKGVFADIATNADFVKKRIADANYAIQNTGEIAEDAQKKENDFAGVVARIGNEFKTAFTNETFTQTIKGVGQILLWIVKIITAIPFAVWVTGLSLVTAAWAASKKEIIAETFAKILNNDQSLLSISRNVALKLGILKTTQARAASTAGTIANTEALGKEAAATVGAKDATIALNTSLKVSPLGAILAIVGLLIPSVVLFASSLNKLHTQVDALNEVNQKANEIAGQQEAALKRNYEIAKNTNLSLKVRQDAVTEMSKIDSRFNGILLNQKDALDQLNKSYKDVIASIRLKAQAEAAGTLAEGKYQEADKYTSLLQRVHAASKGKTVNDAININDLSDDDKKIIGEIDPHGNIFNSNYKLPGFSGQKTSLRGTLVNEVIKRLKDQQDKLNRQADQYINIQTTAQQQLATSGENTGNNNNTSSGNQDLDSLQKQLANINKQIESLDAIKNKSSEQQKQLQLLRKQRSEIRREIKELGGSVTTPKEHADTLGADNQNALKAIDSDRDNTLATYELSIAQLRKQHDLSSQEEINYLKRLQQINDDADNKKIAAIKGSNAAEQAERAKLQLGIINRANDTADKIKALTKKEYDDRAALLKKHFEDQKAQIDLNEEHAKYNLGMNNEQFAIAQTNADEQRLQATKDYYSSLIALSTKNKDKLQGIELEKNKAISDAQKKMLDDQLKIAQARYQDINDIGDNLESRTRDVYSQRANNILADTNLSDDEKKQKLQKNEDELTSSLLQIAAAKALAILNATKESFKNGTATQADVSKAQADYSEAIKNIGVNNLNNKDKGQVFQDVGSTSDFITKGGAKALGFDLDSKQYKQWSAVVNDSMNTAQHAMQNYFDVEQINIENSLKLKERQIDAEKRVALGHAQSAAEQETIERESQEKQLAAQKAAFEQNKKMQKAQAEINLGMQLSNLAVVAFAPNAQNILTGGIWGTVFLAVQTALALVNYALTINKINAAQFAGGGLAGKTPIVPIGNGKITASSNIPTQPNGDNIFATIKTGEVVLNERQQKMLGGDKTFAAIGVPGFANGGKLFDYGGTLGMQYSAPAFYSRNDNGSYDAINNNAENIGKALVALQAVNQRIDKIEVVQVTSSVTKAQKKEVQQKSIGSL